MDNDEKKVSQLRVQHIFDKIHVQLQSLRIELESQGDPVTMEFMGQIEIAILKPIHGIGTKPGPCPGSAHPCPSSSLRT